MQQPPYDLVVSAVLFRTPTAEIEKMKAMVSAIPLRTHLIFVDNDPDKAVSELCGSAVTVIATGANLGYGRAHNIAFERSAGLSPFHLVANTDIDFDGPGVANMVARMDRRADVGLMAPAVRYPNGDRQFLCRLLPTPIDLIGRRFLRWSAWGRRREDAYELRNWSYDREVEIPFLSGCFMLMRRSTLERVGGFDPRFFLYFEDLDLSRRFNGQSRTLFFPGTTITHLYRSKQQRFRALRQLIVSAVRYFNKWGWFYDADRDLINAATLASLFSRTRPGGLEADRHSTN